VSWAKIFLGCFIGILTIIGWEYVRGEPIFPARLMMLYVLGAAFLLVIIGREILLFVKKRLLRQGKGVLRTLVIGSSEVMETVIEQLSGKTKSGYEVIAVAGPKKFLPTGGKIKRYEEVEEALDEIKRQRIDAIIQTNLYEESAKNKAVLHAAQTHHISYSFIPGEPEFYSGKNVVDVFLGYPMISVSQTPLIGWSVILKRAFDLGVVIFTTPLWGTVFVLLALMQKIFNSGPVFFKQRRLGRYGKQFNFIKFRSMRPELSGQSALEIFEKMGRRDLVREYEKNRKVENDPRIAGWFGKFLRATSLDEIPQILNVLRGDMSLVGPRPILPDELDFYKTRSPLLLSVKPGMTGLASVSGRSDLLFGERVKLELFYAQNWTFGLDIKILFKTVRVVVSGHGAK
jgi:exopolysaccharide biosynthesis polyprenyl glycosylphosphotransferase